MTAIRHDATEGESTALPRVYVLILNWNGWADTIECLESVFRSDYPNFRVIVCDNASANHSLELMKAWAEGGLNVLKPDNETIRPLSHPPISKPIAYHEYSRADAERGGSPSDKDYSLVFIQTGANLGFAGGCNVGLRYALARGDFDYVWLLNNDTVIACDALAKLVGEMMKDVIAGMCGSTVLYYDNPQVVQALGGIRYNRWLGISHMLGHRDHVGENVDSTAVVTQMTHLLGASMLVSREFVKAVGLMCEDYFLYYEEIDWAMRGRAGFRLAYAPRSIVYHKGGSVIGTDSNQRIRSLKSEYYLKRNRLLFSRKFFPMYLPLVYMFMLATVFEKILIGRWDVARMMLRLMLTWR